MPIVAKTRKIIIGIDEAGRGPLAGPVVSAAVIIKKKIPFVADSKSLTLAKREALFDLIINEAIAFGVGVASVQEIEKLNILNATFLSMRRALDSLFVNYRQKNNKELKNFEILVDGNKKIKGLTFPQRAVVSGDRLIYEISSASIIAKVVRDRMMRSFAKRYPGFGFERHKGYATGEHREKILKLGPSALHRKSFLRNLLNDEQKLFR